MSFDEAVAYCENLTEDGRDDWRLTTIDELRAFSVGCPQTETGGNCAVTEACNQPNCWSSVCDGCALNQGPGAGGAYWPEDASGPVFWYWSATAAPGQAHEALWCLNPAHGGIFYAFREQDGFHARCIRP